MLNHDDGDAHLANALDQFHGSQHLGWVQPGQQFVQQKQFGSGSQGTREFQPLAIHKCEILSFIRGTRGQPNLFQDLERIGLSLALFLVESWPYTLPIVTLSNTVNCGNGRASWNVRAMPSQQRLCCAVAVMSFPSKRICPLIGRIDSGDQVEQSGFSRTIGTDQPDDLTLVNTHRHVINSHESVE